MEEIFGEVVRTDFEDADYGPDPMYPSNNECSNVKDDDSSDDDKIEELYADPTEPARERVWDVDRVEVVIDPMLPSTAHVYGCMGM